MIKKFIVFFVLLLYLLFFDCGSSNPVTNVDRNDPVSPDDAVKQVVETRVGNSIERINYDTINEQTNIISKNNPSNFGYVYFGSNSLIESVFKTQTDIEGLAKKSSIFYSTFDFRISSVNALTLQFVSITSGKEDTLDFAFPVVDGKCATTTVRVPLGSKYEVLVSLWHIKGYPWIWNTYKLYDRCFLSLDTIDLSSRNSDTLDIIFYESQSIKFFLALEKPPGDWTEDSSYVVYIDSLEIPAMYKNDTLFCHYVIPDMDAGSPYPLIMDCDTGMVSTYFYPKIGNISDNGIVEVESRRIIEGELDTSETGSLLDDFPTRSE